MARSIAARLNANCCGTTCSKVDISRAVGALEQANEEFANAHGRLYIRYKVGAKVIYHKRDCVVLNYSCSFVAVVFPDGHIEVTHQDMLYPARRLP